MRAAEAIELALDGVEGVVTVDEPIVILGGPFRMLSPGDIDLATLRETIGDGDAREWLPGDAS